MFIITIFVTIKLVLMQIYFCCSMFGEKREEKKRKGLA